MSTDPPKEPKEFSEWFVKEYAAQLYRTISRRLIPNRYSIDDVKHYMVERILDIMQKREKKGNPIKEPKIYFRKLIPYWCVEFQRMHGFIYGLPKRPRCPEAEAEISKHGFVYLKSETDNFDGAANISCEHIIKTSYIDGDITEPILYYHNYKVTGGDPDAVSEVWYKLVSALKKEEAGIIACLYRYNLTVPQAAKKLGIAVSTAYQRKERALNTLSGYIIANAKLHEASWQTFEELIPDE